MIDMPAVLVLALIPLAYLLGTFPSAGIVAKAKGHDVTREGSGNPGASNTFRLLGWKAGLLVLILDIGKGSLAAGVGLAIDNHRGAYILGVAAVLGHVLPITRRFKGGRGVATAAGVLAVVFPLVVSIVGVLWFAIARSAQGVGCVDRVCARVSRHRGGAWRWEARPLGHDRSWRSSSWLGISRTCVACSEAKSPVSKTPTARLPTIRWRPRGSVRTA